MRISVAKTFVLVLQPVITSRSRAIAIPTASNFFIANTSELSGFHMFVSEHILRRLVYEKSSIRMRYMERRGSGLKKIVNETANLQGYIEKLKPKFRSDTSFRVTIYNVNYYPDGLNVGKDVGLNVGINVGLKRAEQILILIRDSNTITAEEMAAIFNVTERTIDRDIFSLRKQNRLRRIGSKKSGYWEIT